MSPSVLPEILNGFSAYEALGQWLEKFPCYFVRLPFPEKNGPQGPVGTEDQSLIALSFQSAQRVELHDFPAKLPDFGLNDWWFASISYEAGLTSNGVTPLNENPLSQPAIACFQPQWVLCETNRKWSLLFSGSDDFPQEILSSLREELQKPFLLQPPLEFNLTHLPDFNRYKSALTEIRNHLKRGDIYELNYCISAWGEFKSMEPHRIFKNLASITYAPFSTLVKYDHLTLISASPERFVKSDGKTMFLQPMKGTAKRFPDDPEADKRALDSLLSSEKERAENVMIVDLSRNDLSKFSGYGVSVSELFGHRTLKNVHQLVSTIQAPAPASISWPQLIKCLFPPGSMTGAPKISAIHIINKLENFYRGLFSGITGFIQPGGKFDFCVVIRSIIADTAQGKCLVPAGSAITLLSSDELEYNECLLKLEAMLFALNPHGKAFRT